MKTLKPITFHEEREAQCRKGTNKEHLEHWTRWYDEIGTGYLEGGNEKNPYQPNHGDAPL